MGKHLNVEIKARSHKNKEIRRLLKEKKADFRGLDHQIDTYFTVDNGRLKLREGNIENSLIHYTRNDRQGPKTSAVTLCQLNPNPDLKAVLKAGLGIWKVVDKKREIYFIDNVKFHLDEVNGLGDFVEIEAIDKEGTMGLERLHEQCAYYLQHFDIAAKDLIKGSYSDMVW